jgi:hypothetical protein
LRLRPKLYQLEIAFDNARDVAGPLEAIQAALLAHAS